MDNVAPYFFYYLGKEWGQTDGEPWIALHGWLDNCGSFDKLIPYFPKTQRIIAIGKTNF